MWLKRIAIVLAALIPVAIVGAFVFQSGDDQAATTAPASSTSTPTTGSTTTAPASGTSAVTSDVATDVPATYQDGTYTAEGPYTSPAGSENITVTLTLASDVVVDMSVVTHGVGPSALWQGKFVSGIEAAVIGKSIDELNLANVSGSSLTPGGFNAAVASIKTQAAI